MVRFLILTIVVTMFTWIIVTLFTSNGEISYTNYSSDNVHMDYCDIIYCDITN